MRYFQTFEGGYAEGDVHGRDDRKVAKMYFDQWDERVLRSGHPIHEVRHTALFRLMRYRSANAVIQSLQLL